MAWNLKRNQGRGRPSWLVAAALTIVMLTPVAAFAGGTWDDTGPTGGGTTTGGPPGPPEGAHPNIKCGQMIGKLPGALYYLTGGHWTQMYMADHPGCDGEPPLPSGAYKLCPTGFEVYRFYGYKGEEPIAVTRSQVNLTRWCDPEGTYSFTGQTTWDATPNTAPGSPDADVVGTNPDRARNNQYSQWVRRENGFLTSGKPTLVQGSCQAVSKTNPLIKWWNNANKEARVNFRAAIGQAYWNTLWAQTQNHNEPDNGKWNEDSAALELGFAKVKGYFYKTRPSDPKAAPTPMNVQKYKESGKGSAFYASSFTFETRKCASPMNFARVLDPETQQVKGKTPITGTCYIPTLTATKEFLNGRGYRSLEAGFGERYSRYYVTKNGGKDRPYETATGDPTPASWRKAMKEDYLKRYHATGNDWLDGAGNQVLPANGYPAELNNKLIPKAAPINVQKAANQLANWSKCRFGTTATMSDTEAPPPTKATLMLDAYDRQVLQVGGATHRAQFRVRAQALMCGGSPCGSRAKLTQLSYKMDLVGLDGYTKCATAQSVNCDYRITQYIPGGVNKDGILEAEFYRATTPTQRVKFVVSNLQAKYKFAVQPSTVSLQGTDPVTGEPFTISASATGYSVTKSLTPKLQGIPTFMPGPTDGAYSIKYPVMGATDMPRR